jgi:hypothetical protein
MRMFVFIDKFLELVKIMCFFYLLFNLFFEYIQYTNSTHRPIQGVSQYSHNILFPTRDFEQRIDGNREYIGLIISSNGRVGAWFPMKPHECISDIRCIALMPKGSASIMKDVLLATDESSYPKYLSCMR